MIVETIISTLDEAGSPNFAPMGLVWGEDFVIVRPFRNTRTCRNLLRSGYGVASLTDNALAYVRCGLYKEVPGHFPARVIPGAVLEGTCSWLEMALISAEGTEERAELRCQVLHRGRKKDFLGFCRAGSAVIEATILATRLEQIDRRIMAERLVYYSEIVEKTGGESEKEAFRLVHDYVAKFAITLQKRGRDD